MKKEEKKLKLIEVSRDKGSNGTRSSFDWENRISFAIQIDETISDEDLESKEFMSFVKKSLIELPQKEIKSVKLEDISDLSDLDLETRLGNFSFYGRGICYGVYKNKHGEFSTCVALEYPNLQSTLYVQKALYGETWDFTQIYLSCLLETAKELWNKGEIEKLKSYYIDDSMPLHSKGSDVIDEIYDWGRNEEVSIRSRSHYQKQDCWFQNKEGCYEVLNKVELDSAIRLSEQEGQLNYLLEMCVYEMVQAQGGEVTLGFMNELKGHHMFSKNPNWGGLVDATIEEIKEGVYG